MDIMSPSLWREFIVDLEFDSSVFDFCPPPRRGGGFSFEFEVMDTWKVCILIYSVGSLISHPFVLLLLLLVLRLKAQALELVIKNGEPSRRPSSWKNSSCMVGRRIQ